MITSIAINSSVLGAQDSNESKIFSFYILHAYNYIHIYKSNIFLSISIELYIYTINFRISILITMSVFVQLRRSKESMLGSYDLCWFMEGLFIGDYKGNSLALNRDIQEEQVVSTWYCQEFPIVCEQIHLWRIFPF